MAGALSGTDPGLLAGDPAIARCAVDPVPLVSAAMSGAAVRRAAGLGVGLLFDSLSTPERIRELSDAYHEAGGNRPCVLVRRAWVGAPPTEQVERQVDRYRSYASAGAQAHWQGEQLVAADDATSLAEELAAVAARAGVDALNLRIHVPGVSPTTARDQIAAMGDVVAVLPRPGRMTRGTSLIHLARHTSRSCHLAGLRCAGGDGSRSHQDPTTPCESSIMTMRQGSRN